MDKIRTAPHSKESEMMVLGCMLTSANSLNIGSDALSENDFYFAENKAIFGVLKNLYKQDKPADIHLVCEELKRIEKLQSVGGASYVTGLAQYAGTSAYIEEYAEIVQSKSMLRRMIGAAQEVEKVALHEPEDVHAALDDAQQAFFRISQSANAKAGLPIFDVLSGVQSKSGQPYLKELEERQEKFATLGPEDTGITGIATNFTDLDPMINGLGNSHLLIIAGRPGMGKTALAVNIAEQVCFKEKIPVGIFSLEMTAEQLVHRIVCSQSEVESDKIRTGSLSGLEYQRVVAAVNEMQNHKLIIDDQPGLRITDLRARARRMKEVHGVGLIIVDYLQLISGSNNYRSGENRQMEVSEISRMLKNLARELDIPVIVGAQLSRKVEERQGHRPMISDLRESGCLTGDTLITNAITGQRVTIKELAERQEQTPFPVLAINKDWKIGIHDMSKAFYSGKKEVFLLKTRSGRTIKASANHPFLAIEGWTRLDELSPGDRIALPRQTKPKFSSNPLSDDELILLAHLLGDGCILKHQPYHYTSADPENIAAVRETSRRLFGIEGRLVKQKNWWHFYLPSPYRLTHNRFHPITNWYNKLGIERARSYNKQLPDQLYQCDDDKISLFLRHLWATDGAVNFKKMKGRKPTASLYYGTTSYVLAQDVQNLLLRIGIATKLRKVPQRKGKYRSMYHVYIEGKEDQLRFLTKVRCHGERGRIIPQLIALLGEITSLAHADIIPKQAWDLYIRPEQKRVGVSWREVAKRLEMSYCGSSLFKSSISRERMSKLSVALEESPVLQKLAESDILWDGIVSIEAVGTEDVYDATVPGVHNFLANDIIVHNSLEQDADIVMLLLRREYYDPLDKPGMAELIVAKNRHGAVGNVNLTYRKEIVRFDNYSPMVGPEDEMDEAFAEFS